MSSHHQQGLDVNLFDTVPGPLKGLVTLSTASEIEQLRSVSIVRDRVDE
jgi:hypothetical protein